MLERKTKTLVSFIIPCYNVPVAMLKECVESILALSLSDKEREIIIVDDGSAASPLHGLQECIDKVIYIRKENGGVSTARNMGLRMARGEYVQFVDADDLLLQAPYEHCLDYARYAKPDIVAFGFTNKEKVETEYEDLEQQSGADYLKNNNIYGSAWSYLFKASIRGNLEFAPNVAYTEDERFTPQLIVRADTVQPTNAKAYFYRKHGRSVTMQHDRRHVVQQISDELTTILSLRQVADTLPAYEQKAMQRRIAQLTMNYMYNVIVKTRSMHQLNRCIVRLENLGLFPLPDKEYTKKYKWFRRMSNSPAGRRIMLHTLPYIKREA